MSLALHEPSTGAPEVPATSTERWAPSAPACEATR